MHDCDLSAESREESTLIQIMRPYLLHRCDGVLLAPTDQRSSMQAPQHMCIRQLLSKAAKESMTNLKCCSLKM